jgi:putative autotransporter adhesin-like protein
MTSIRRPLHAWTPAVVFGGIGLAALAAVTIFLLASRDNSTTSGSGVVGSVVAATQSRSVPPFSAIELSGSNNLIVNASGERSSVVVHADSNLLSHVTSRVQGSTLVIGNTPGDFASKAPMSVEIAVPSLDQIVLSGSGNITAEGSTARLDVVLSGSGNLQLGGLAADEVRATLTGSGTIRVTASKSFAGTIGGSGTIFYGGNPPQVKTSVTGSGVILPT